MKPREPLISFHMSREAFNRLRVHARESFVSVGTFIQYALRYFYGSSEEQALKNRKGAKRMAEYERKG